MSERVNEKELFSTPPMTMACHIKSHNVCPNPLKCQCPCHPTLYTQAQLDQAVRDEQELTSNLHVAVRCAFSLLNREIQKGGNREVLGILNNALADYADALEAKRKGK